MTYRSILISTVAFSMLCWAGAASADVRYGVTDLGTFGGDYSSAADINNNGQIVGEAKTSDGLSRAFLYQNGTMTNLGTIDGYSESVASGINSSGQIVGTAMNDLPYPMLDNRAFLYSNGTMTNLGVLSGYDCSSVSSINDYGQISGTSFRNQDVVGTGKDTGVIGSTNSEFGRFISLSDYVFVRSYSMANSLNNNGKVVGYSTKEGYSSGVYTNNTFYPSYLGKSFIYSNDQMVGWELG